MEALDQLLDESHVQRSLGFIVPSSPSIRKKGGLKLPLPLITGDPRNANTPKFAPKFHRSLQNATAENLEPSSPMNTS